ncbi:MAG: cell division protein SepF [Clostridia bacterium]|nr:cell division protein SepF [Clostridia bacterium]
MSFIDKLKRTAGADNEYDDYESENDYYDEFDSNKGSSYDGAGEASQDDTQVYSPMNPNNGYGVSRSAGISVSGSALEMKVVRPEHFESVKQIADHLLEHRTVVLNLEKTNKETARRLIDFLSGVAYSINGSLKKIATSAYIITPDNVDVGDASLKNGSKGAENQEEPEEKANPRMNDEYADF